MKLEQALAFDKTKNLLPGGQGEHDFNLLWTPQQIDEHLNNYAEYCGGMFSMFGERQTKAKLYTGSEGVYQIELSPDRSRVYKVWRIHDDGRFTLYWDYRRERVVVYGYQYRNAHKPWIEDLELTIAERDEDDARKARELAETPPPPPPRIDHDAIFRAKLGLTEREVMCPKLNFQLINWDSNKQIITNVLWEGEATLQEMEIRRLKMYEDDSNLYFSKDSNSIPLIYLPTNYEDDGAPKPGDIIKRVRQPGQYMHGLSGVFDLRWKDELGCTYSPSPFWNPIYALHKQGSPSCSGGPCDTPKIEKCIKVGQDLRYYWYWKDGYAQANNGANYHCLVDVWHWID